MEVRITKGKEFLKDKGIRFTLTVETLSLSAEEQALVQKYGDPTVRARFVTDLNQYQDAKITDAADTVSKLKISASATQLPPMLKYEAALVERLGQHLAYLHAVDAWEGEKKLSL